VTKREENELFVIADSSSMSITIDIKNIDLWIEKPLSILNFFIKIHLCFNYSIGHSLK